MSALCAKPLLGGCTLEPLILQRLTRNAYSRKFSKRIRTPLVIFKTGGRDQSEFEYQADGKSQDEKFRATERHRCLSAQFSSVFMC
jgi:hypothetical protein